jgi:predicted ATPase
MLNDCTLWQGSNIIAPIALAWNLIGAASVGIFGMVLMTSDNFEEGYRCGQLALKLMEAFKRKELTARTHTAVFGFLNCYRNPVRDSITHLRDAYTLNMVTGDVEVRTYLRRSTANPVMY